MQDNSVVAESSERKSADGPPSDPPSGPRPNGLNPGQPVEGENQQQDNENSVENQPERVPVWNVGVTFGSG